MNIHLCGSFDLHKLNNEVQPSFILLCLQCFWHYFVLRIAHRIALCLTVGDALAHVVRVFSCLKIAFSLHRMFFDFGSPGCHHRQHSGGCQFC